MSSDRRRPGAARARASPGLELHVFVGRGECPAGDEPEARLRHPGTGRMDEAEFPDRCVDGLVVHELLDPVEHRLAALTIELAGLLSEEPVDVGIATVDVGTAGGDERLEADRRIPEGAADAVDEILELLLLVRLEEARPLERPHSRSDSHRLEIAGRGLAHRGGGGVAPEVSRVEPFRITRLAEELLGLCRIVGVCGRLPEEVEALGNDAPGDPREAERDRLVDGRAVDRVVGGEAHAPVRPRRLRVPTGRGTRASGSTRSAWASASAPACAAPLRPAR